MRAIALLSIWKFRNSLRSLFTDPRKLIPFLLVAFSVICGVGSALISTLIPHRQQLTQTVDPVLLHAITSVVMLIVGLTILDMGLGDKLLAFAMPDVDYLFPSPISRRVVLAYRLPMLTWSALIAGGIFLFIFTVISSSIGIVVPNKGSVVPPSWLKLAAVCLCIGIYFNLALFIAIQFRNLNFWHRVVTGAIVALLVGLGILAWKSGIPTAVSVVELPWVQWALAPSHLAADAIYASFCHQPYASPLSWLLIGYVASIVVLFSANVNYYEQSIVSTERASTMRQAAKGGYASLIAARAANFKHRSTREYTVTPFGKGPFALFWAHLSAAAKKPLATFITPFALGIGLGIASAEANQFQKGVGFAVLAFCVIYSSFGFLAAGKTASEAAIRRRELLSPLPIPGWKAVAANLGVPWVVVFLFGIGAAGAYIALGGDQWPLVTFCLAILFPLHTMTRMAVQYGLSIGYVDLSDKVQQLLGGLMYYVFAGPLTAIEAVLAIPALLLQSFWVGAITIALFQIPLLAGLLVVAGRASDRAVASGEPVTLFSALRKQT